MTLADVPVSCEPTSFRVSEPYVPLTVPTHETCPSVITECREPGLVADPSESENIRHRTPSLLLNALLD